MSGPLRLMLCLLLAMGACGASKAAEPQQASKLAPTVPYLELWTFVYGKDATLPKVLYLPSVPEEGEEGGGSAEPPSWLTSAAMGFKEGRSYTAKFAVVAAGDSARVAKRFGIEAEELPVLLGCRVADGGSGGVAQRLPKSDLRAGGGTTVRAVKDFVKDLVAGNEAEEALALPSFPEPTRPRKQATASLDEFTHESLPLSCYAGSRPLCVLAVLDQAAGNGCPQAMSEVARKFRNDKSVGFGCVGAARQHDFLKAYGLSAADLPALVAVKGGKRPRAATMPPAGGAALEASAMSAFVESVIDGRTTFSRLADGLPELEAPYLLDADDAAPKDEV